MLTGFAAEGDVGEAELLLDEEVAERIDHGAALGLRDCGQGPAVKVPELALGEAGDEEEGRVAGGEVGVLGHVGSRLLAAEAPEQVAGAALVRPLRDEGGELAAGVGVGIGVERDVEAFLGGVIEETEQWL